MSEQAKPGAVWRHPPGGEKEEYSGVQWSSLNFVTHFTYASVAYKQHLQLETKITKSNMITERKCRRKQEPATD